MENITWNLAMSSVIVGLATFGYFLFHTSGTFKALDIVGLFVVAIIGGLVLSS